MRYSLAGRRAPTSSMTLSQVTLKVLLTFNVLGFLFRKYCVFVMDLYHNLEGYYKGYTITFVMDLYHDLEGTFEL